jgi:hypothetical protein
MPSSTSTSTTVRRWSMGAEALCLLGLESPPFVEDRFDFAYLSTRSDGAKVAGPLLVEHRLTGYRPSKRRVDLPRVVTALATKRIELEPNGAELGALTIEFRGRSPSSRSATRRATTSNSSTHTT